MLCSKHFIPYSRKHANALYCSYLNFSFKLRGIQQSDFEGDRFKSFGAFLRRFEVLVWGRLLRRVICFFVFIKMLGVLLLCIEIQKTVTTHTRFSQLMERIFQTTAPVSGQHLKVRQLRFKLLCSNYNYNTFTLILSLQDK